MNRWKGLRKEESLDKKFLEKLVLIIISHSRSTVASIAVQSHIITGSKIFNYSTTYDKDFCTGQLKHWERSGCDTAEASMANRYLCFHKCSYGERCPHSLTYQKPDLPLPGTTVSQQQPRHISNTPCFPIHAMMWKSIKTKNSDFPLTAELLEFQ